MPKEFIYHYQYDATGKVVAEVRTGEVEIPRTDQVVSTKRMLWENRGYDEAGKGLRELDLNPDKTPILVDGKVTFKTGSKVEKPTEYIKKGAGDVIVEGEL